MLILVLGLGSQRNISENCWRPILVPSCSSSTWSLITAPTRLASMGIKLDTWRASVECLICMDCLIIGRGTTSLSDRIHSILVLLKFAIVVLSTGIFLELVDIL